MYPFALHYPILLLISSTIHPFCHTTFTLARKGHIEARRRAVGHLNERRSYPARPRVPLTRDRAGVCGRALSEVARPRGGDEERGRGDAPDRDCVQANRVCADGLQECIWV